MNNACFKQDGWKAFCTLGKYSQNIENCDHFIEEWRVYGGEPAAVCKYFEDDTCNCLSEDAIKEVKLIDVIEDL